MNDEEMKDRRCFRFSSRREKERKQLAEVNIFHEYEYYKQHSTSPEREMQVKLLASELNI